jgi:hypothetical protein
MTARYSVKIGWNSSAMSEVAYGKGFWDANVSTLQRMAREQDVSSPVRLIFDFNASDVPEIHELMQLWAGWVDGTAYLQGPDPPFMGFLTQLEGGGAAVHTISGQVNSLQFLNTRATVIGWPTGESDGLPTAGYPPDYSVTNWLVGTAPYPGVVRSYVANALYDGVDPAFDSLVLDATAIPGGNTDALVGQWGFTTLDAILQDLVGVARYVAARDGNLIEPVYFWETVAQGSVLRPRFRFIDINDTTGTLKATFSVSPAAGEFYMEDFHHTRDGKDVRTDVVVKGIGSEGGALIYSRYQGHVDDYPCEYLPNGWGGDPYTDTSIGTLATADAVAAAIGYRVWGALGALNWRTDGVAVGGTALTYFEPGDIIALYDPAEGQFNTRYVVRRVTPDGGTAGHPTYRIEVGDVLPNIKDLIRGATIVQPHRRAVATGSGTNTRGASLGTHGLPGAPPQVVMEARPVHSQQNNMRAAFTNVIDLTTDQPTQLPPGVDPDNPPEPAKRQLHRDQYGNHRQWLGPEGADAVQHWSFPVSAAGTVPISVPDPATYVEERLLFLDGSDASGSVTTSYALNGSPVSNPTVSTPIVAARDQVLAITFAGTFTNPISFKLTSSPPPVVP